MTPSLILASTSVYRRQLLERLGVPFTCEKPEVDETPRLDEAPLDLSTRLAREKALAVARRFPGSVVIGSDQVCVCDGEALGKPHTFERASEQLRLMSGKTLVFHTAVCVVGSDGNIQECVSDTTLKMRELTDEAIVDYLRREEPYDCAGSAKIESLGIALVESFSSDDPTSLMGLPLIRVTDMLKKNAIAVLKGL